MNSLDQGFALDSLRVEPLTGLVSGPGGREKLDPKVMNVLMEMAGHAGEVVLREDLLGRLWPNVVVTDDALTRCCYELRRQLARAGGDERYRSLIETLPKRGYRLNARVEPFKAPGQIPTPAAPPRHDLSLLTAIGSAAALIAIGVALYFWRSPEVAVQPADATAPHSIAVLPFLDMSAEGDQGYFSDGVTEEILNRLSQSDNLRVISRTSSFSLRNETLDVPRIAARLNVSYVLEGSIRKSGQRVRITAQLIDATTNSHIWSQTYDRSLNDLFAVQDEIAASVATALQVTLAGKEPGEHIPSNIQAYEQFLQGQFFHNRRSPGDIERALDRYKQAVAGDPGYARAWAALAGAYSLLIGEMDQDQATAAPMRDLQGEAARKAVELDPHLAVAQARYAQYLYHIRRYKEADEHMRLAATLDSNDSLVLGFSASDAIWNGNYPEAARLWRRATAQDPLSSVTRGNLGYMLLLNGQLEEALSESRKALELNPDAGPQLATQISRNLIMLGRYDEAAIAIEKLPEGNERDYALALLHRAPGKHAIADAALARLAAAHRDIPNAIHLAEVYADRGEKDRAFETLAAHYRQLERNRAIKPRNLWYFQDEMRLSPYLKPLQADARWSEVATVPD